MLCVKYGYAFGHNGYIKEDALAPHQTKGYHISR